MIDTLLSSTFLADLLVRGVIILAAAIIALPLMRRRSAAERHVMLSVALVALLILPAMMLLMPTWRTLPASMSLAPLMPASHSATSAIQSAPAVSSASTAASISIRQPINWRGVIAAGWAIVAVLCLLPIPIGIWRLRHIAATCSDMNSDAEWNRVLSDAKGRLSIRHHVALRMSEDQLMPMTFGMLHPTIILPAQANEWSTSRCRAVVVHELAHIKRLDCLTYCISRIGCAIHWPNPLAWWGLWRIDAERERACDDAVLRLGTQPSAYAEELLAVGSQMPAMPLLLAGAAMMPMAKPSRLGQRVGQVLGEHSRAAASSRQAGIVMIALLLLIVPLAAIKADPTTEPSDADKPKILAFKDMIMNVAGRMREMDFQLVVYAENHKGQLPHQLSDTISQPHVKADIYCTADDQATNPPPTPLTADWVNQHTSWIYLGGDTKLNHLKGGNTSNTVAFHSSVEHPFHSPTNGDKVCLAFADGHIQIEKLDFAKTEIDRSKAIWTASRDAAAATTQPAQ